MCVKHYIISITCLRLFCASNVMRSFNNNNNRYFMIFFFVCCTVQYHEYVSLTFYWSPTGFEYCYADCSVWIKSYQYINVPAPVLDNVRPTCSIKDNNVNKY